MRVKLLNFIIVHKDSLSGFRIHDFPHRRCCPESDNNKGVVMFIWLKRGSVWDIDGVRERSNFVRSNTNRINIDIENIMHNYHQMVSSFYAQISNFEVWMCK
jgi:hypothetical protein